MQAIKAKSFCLHEMLTNNSPVNIQSITNLIVDIVKSLLELTKDPYSHELLKEREYEYLSAYLRRISEIVEYTIYMHKKLHGIYVYTFDERLVSNIDIVREYWDDFYGVNHKRYTEGIPKSWQLDPPLEKQAGKRQIAPIGNEKAILSC